ncbi:hypothetical protein EU555_00745 [Methylobacterium nonmethylotrophicum]|uniref:DUF2946 domain-containing protein n=2 Tax=Methylobacterium nonmethylotrophicum TaxID=1141884 RepID=A0A4Z0NXZ3_9HYPH|nr:hypothetical protein EU555_00745 [Methylobacterium nonmethylotrophicum]
MSDRRHESGRRTARWRAAAAVLSLYGLLLQAFLVGLNPAPVMAGAGIICQSHQDAGTGSGAPAHGHACCTVACPGPLAPPEPVAGPGWPPRAAIGLSWRIDAAAPPRGPPSRPSSARGPPAA